MPGSIFRARANRHVAPLRFLEGKLIEDHDPDDLRIDYVEKWDFSGQPMHDRRVQLIPEIDFTLYNPRAVIDWLEIGWHSADTYRAQVIGSAAKRWLKRRGSRSTAWITGPERKPGYEGKEFVCLIQDPDPKELREFLEFIESEYVVQDEIWHPPFQVTGLEISLDFYVRGSEEMTDATYDYHRWRMTDLIRRHTRYWPFLWEVADHTPRRKSAIEIGRLINRNQSRSKKIVRALGSRSYAVNPTNYRQCPVDATWYMIEEKNEIRFRSMDKVTDKRTPDGVARKILSKEESRSRIEITFEDPIPLHHEPVTKAIDIEFPEDLFGYKFSDLKKPCFDFYLPTFQTKDGKIDAKELEVFRKAGIAGLEHYQTAMLKLYGGALQTKNTKGFNQAFVEMNHQVTKALRKLEREWVT